MDKSKKTIRLYIAAPRSGKTRKICGNILKNSDISNFGKTRILFTVGMVGDRNSDDSTAISTIKTIKSINPFTTSVLLTSKVKICKRLFSNKMKIDDNPEYIKYLCSKCKREKKITVDKMLQTIEEHTCKILSFDELMNIYNMGMCPEVFSKMYSQYCEMTIISKSKLEMEMTYGGSINIFNKYELYIDEAHSMFNFCDVSPIVFSNCITNGKLNLKIIRDTLNDLYYNELQSFIKKYNVNDKIYLMSLDLIKKRLDLLIELIIKSLRRNEENMLSDDFNIKMFHDLEFLSDALYSRAINEKNYLKQGKLFKLKSSVDSLMSLNGKYLITDVSNFGSITLRLYNVINSNGNKVISNPLKNELFEKSDNTTLITSTPFYPEYFKLWFDSDNYNVKLVTQEFTGTFYIFYTSGSCGVKNTFSDKYLNRHQKLISVLSDEFDKSGDLYVLARNLLEKSLMEKYFANFRNPTFDDYVGSRTSEGVQRNEALSVMFGFAYVPIDDYKQSAHLFRNTIGKNYPVEKVRTDFINMLSAMRTTQAMFRNADLRYKRAHLIVNLSILELNLIKKFPLYRDKNIKFIEIPKNLRIEMYPKFIRKYIG